MSSMTEPLLLSEFKKAKKNYEIPDVASNKIKNVMVANASLKKKFEKIDSLKPANNLERAQKEVFRYM
jgi:hypothetical protein